MIGFHVSGILTSGLKHGPEKSGYYLIDCDEKVPGIMFFSMGPSMFVKGAKAYNL